VFGVAAILLALFSVCSGIGAWWALSMLHTHGDLIAGGMVCAAAAWAVFRATAARGR
jgi:hypothetical protein